MPRLGGLMHVYADLVPPCGGTAERFARSGLPGRVSDRPKSGISRSGGPAKTAAEMHKTMCSNYTHNFSARRAQDYPRVFSLRVRGIIARKYVGE